MPRRRPRSSAGCVARSRPRRPSSSCSTDRPSAACATSGSRPGWSSATAAARTADEVILTIDRRRPDARRRRRHGGPPGRHRRPRPAPRVAAARARGRRARRGCSGGSEPAGCARHRSATRGRRAAPGPAADAGHVERRRPGRDRPSVWKPGRGATTKKGNPRKAPRTAERRPAGLVGCGREHRRRPEPDLDPDPRGHVDLRDARLGRPDRPACRSSSCSAWSVPFLTFLALGTMIYLVRKPRTKVTFEEGPRVAEIGPGGEPIFPVGLPHCRRDGLVYPSGTHPLRALPRRARA